MKGSGRPRSTVQSIAAKWREVHLGIDADILQIRAIVVATNEVGGSPMAVELLEQTPSLGADTHFTGEGCMTRRMLS